MSYNEKLKKWSCDNCKNLKTREVMKEDLEDVSKRALLKAKKMCDYEKLALRFPITYGLYVKVKRKVGNKGCMIFYCKKNLFKRRAYEVKGNLKDNSIINKEKQCPEYDRK